MRILALGGSGDMGRYAVQTLLRFGADAQITIGDIDIGKARSFAAQCGAGVSAAAVDVANVDELGKSIAAAEVVMNTVGPFYRHGMNIFKACLAGGVHYFDINDDWEPTLGMLSQRTEAAAQGVTAVIGMGASPGIANLLAVRAMRELDCAHTVYTGWDLDSARPESVGPRPSAATIHGIHQLSSDITVHREGRCQVEKPIREVLLDYPGIGVRPAWTIGHPEAVTLPRSFPNLRTSVNVVSTSRFKILGIKAIAVLVRTGFLSLERAAFLAERCEGARDPDENAHDLIRRAVKMRRPKLPPLFALATGLKNGKPAGAASMISSAPSGGMGGATGVPLALAVHLFTKGSIAGAGVYAPEGIINPDIFFNALAPLCVPAKKDAQDLVITTRSWESMTVVGALLKQSGCG